MKSERRHELEQNTLAQWLARVIQQVKPYANAILGGVLAIILVFVVVSWWTNESEAQSTKAWDQYYAALSDRSSMVPGLEKVAKDHAGTAAGTWALLTVADLQLDAGCNLLFQNKASANIELRNALDNYLKLLEQSRDPLVLQRATLGQARAREAQGDLAKAQELYERLASRWPQGVYADLAKERLRDVQDQSTKEFSDWFARYDPKPPASQGPGRPGERPDFNLDNLPDGAPPAKSEAASEVKPGTLLDQKPKSDVELPRLKLDPKPASDKPAEAEKKPEDKGVTTDAKPSDDKK